MNEQTVLKLAMVRVGGPSQLTKKIEKEGNPKK
jgi:hypothetical protein